MRLRQLGIGDQSSVTALAPAAGPDEKPVREVASVSTEIA